MLFRKILIFLAFLISCSESDTESPSSEPIRPNVFVGALEGEEALIALVQNEDTVVAYSCGIGENLSTHTGWYFGKRGANLDLINQNTGLRVVGELDEEGGSGTLTLADGREVAWSVEPARGRAGLFDYEDASKLVGFIRDNEGRTAGNSRLSFVGFGRTPVKNLPTSLRVVSRSAPPPRPTPAPVPEPVIIEPPALPPVTVVVNPVVDPVTRVITRTGPVVVFLVHGMSDVGTPDANAPEDALNCSGPRNSPFYGRCEWGQDFLPGVFGTSDVRGQLTNLVGQDVTGDAFLNDPDNRPEFDETLGQELDGECVAKTGDEVHDPKIAHHFIIPGEIKSEKVPPDLAAFVTWRDSTRGLVTSGRRLTRQVYAALRWYEENYDVTPSVVFLTQSFGGLTTRFVLSNPDPALLVDKLNVEKTQLCKEDLAKMDYIRDRTLYMVSLATPHEGSYLAEWGVAGKTLVLEFLQKLIDEQISDLTAAFAPLQAIRTLLQLPSFDFEGVAQRALDDFALYLDAPALTDLQLEVMKLFNLGPLAPENARRTGNSPIIGAQKTLIPVYATLARSPGSDAFDSPKIQQGMREHATKRPKSQSWIIMTMFVSDFITRQVIVDGFGDATVPPYAAHANILDRRARIFDTSPTVAQIREDFGAAIDVALNAVSPWITGEFGADTEDVLQMLNGVPAPQAFIPVHIDQKWTIGFDGTTAEVPIPAFECGSTRILLDFDVLATLLVERFTQTSGVFQAIRNLDLFGVLEAIGVAVEADVELAVSSAEWFLEKIGALGNLPAECNLTPDSPFDIFSLGELANWRIVEATGNLPIPVWIPTGEPVSDGEMDTDGAVHSASALGFTLGEQPFHFEHDRPAGSGFGSWYRLYDNEETERFNHGLQYENSVGIWFNKTFLNDQVGPVPSPTSFSVWPE